MDDNDADFKTYSLAEVAEMILADMADGVRGLSHRLKNGELSGYRVGRTWRMTREDVADVIERQRNRSIARNGGEVLRIIVAGLTPTSRRRRGARRVVIDTSADRSHRPNKGLEIPYRDLANLKGDVAKDVLTPSRPENKTAGNESGNESERDGAAPQGRRQISTVVLALARRECDRH
jgi:hypothetical protein